MYVAHSDITKDKQDLLQGIVSRFKNANLTFVNTGGFFDSLWSNGGFSKKQAGSTFTADCIVRCFAAKLFPQYERIIYSDVDVVINDDISDIYDIDLEDSYLAGVRNPFLKYSEYELSHLPSYEYEKLKDSYLAGGFWVMNLKKIREDNLERKMIDVINDTSFEKRWNDQDVMNIACGSKVQFIPLNYICYPYLPDLLKKNDFKSHYTDDELYDSLINPKIIHYAAHKPWNGNPEYAAHWWCIFDYLKLVKTSIFVKPKKKNKVKVYKVLLWTMSIVTIVEFLLLMFFIRW